MLSILILNADDPKEQAEGHLVEQLARQCGKFDRIAHVRDFPIQTVTRGDGSPRFPTPEALDRFYFARWDIVWFTGHVSERSKGRYSTLDRRIGSRFFKLAHADRLAHNLDTRLLVMSSCTSAPGHGFFPPDFAYTEMVVGHRGGNWHGDLLVFGARFMVDLCQVTRRDRIPEIAVRQAFSDARAATSCAETGAVLWLASDQKVR